MKTISELTMLPCVKAFELMYLIHALTVHEASNFRPKKEYKQIRIVESTIFYSGLDNVVGYDSFL